MEKTKRLVRECIFWPGMSSQIDDLVSKRTICMQQRNNNPREPLLPHKVPDTPWEKAGADLFEWNGKDHLIIVDYYYEGDNAYSIRSTWLCYRLVRFLITAYILLIITTGFVALY